MNFFKLVGSEACNDVDGGRFLDGLVLMKDSLVEIVEYQAQIG